MKVVPGLAPGLAVAEVEVEVEEVSAVLRSAAERITTILSTQT
jgi:hypothetical protein